MADNKKFIEEFMEVTNVYRKRHQVGELTYNTEIEKISQGWADKLVKMNTMSHNKNPKYKGEVLGENIAMRFDSTQSYYSGHRAVGQWYQEIENYSFKNHKGKSTGHFTQLVWKGTREVGVGRSRTKDGKWIVVANYYPAGNIIGHYETNVLPSIDGDTSILISPEEQISVAGDGSDTFWNFQDSFAFAFKSSDDETTYEKTTYNYPNASKDESTSKAGQLKGDSVSTKIIRKIIKNGSDIRMEETITTTRVSPKGKTSVNTQKVIRAPTAEELKKFMMKQN